MTISPVYSGRPDTLREPVEQRVYELLDALHIPYQRVDHEPAYDMDACAGISEALGITICKNLLLTPRNRSAFYLLAMPADLPFRTADFSKKIGSSRLSFASPEDLQALLGVQPRLCLGAGAYERYRASGHPGSGAACSRGGVVRLPSLPQHQLSAAENGGPAPCIPASHRCGAHHCRPVKALHNRNQ